MILAVICNMWHARGYPILYETSGPKGPHYDVVPVQRILGICPLMRLYRNVHGTVPEWADGPNSASYPLGKRHEANSPGSKTYVLNLLGLSYSR